MRKPRAQEGRPLPSLLPFRKCRRTTNASSSAKAWNSHSDSATRSPSDRQCPVLSQMTVKCGHTMAKMPHMINLFFT
ncbi:hypothetical protein CUJ84_Chr004040 [Rhizobium leguminosarum]|uniref:Uncharacterized protein n=1 Tax=Rhizobium leguminosarum TaxID=384 RepID=A0A2K9Z810_RHILE|nr:hypothetical protein CUJ84_Chr004040 [Rhizobium leguminosarum]